MRSAISTTTRRSNPGGTRAPKARRPARKPTGRHSAHDVVSALQAEHRYASLLLDVLEDRLAAVSRGQPLDPEAFLAGMTYMTRHLDGYHHLREDALFALLAKRDPDSAKGIAKVKREHRSIGAAGKRLLAALERFASPGGRAGQAEVISGVGDYVSAMRAHMSLEERELFPRARQLLDKNDLEEIDRAFMRVVDPIFEATVRDAYAAYSPVVRYLAEQPAIQQIVGALNDFLDSAETLGETIFGSRTAAPPVRKPVRPVARRASR